MEIKEKVNNDLYWNHNTAYHKWILSHINSDDEVLDIGCGDGLLAYRLSKVCKKVTGIDTHIHSISKAKERLKKCANTKIIQDDFEKLDENPNSFDVIIFVASLHHMDTEFCLKKSARLLKPDGRLLIVGLAQPTTILDQIIEFVRFIPAKIGDSFHEVTADVGSPIKDETESLKDIKNISRKEIPNAKIKRALYYRYLLSWTKSDILK